MAEPVWRDLSVSRPLGEAEAELVTALAAACREPRLVAQVERCRVVGECRCGCPSLRLAAKGPALAGETVRRLSGAGRDDYVAVRAAGLTDGHRVEVALHVVGGLLAELEVYAGEGARVTLPAAAELTAAEVD